MALPGRLLPHSLIQVAPADTATDAYGDATRDYGDAATRTSFTGWLQQSARSTEHDRGRDEPAEQLWLLMTNHQALAMGDRVEWATHPSGPVTFDVWGPPEPAYRPSGEVHHMEVTLRVWEG